jgi:hypothetical protein
VLLQSETLAVADVQSTVVGDTAFNLPPSVPVTVFDFEANLATPFLTQPGEVYWLSVLSNSPTFNPLWAWFQGTGGDGITIQDQLLVGTRFVRPEDRAFSLEGRVVPEPSSLVLAAAGAGLLFLIAKQRSVHRTSAQNQGTHRRGSTPND